MNNISHLQINIQIKKLRVNNAIFGDIVFIWLYLERIDYLCKYFHFMKALDNFVKIA